MKALILCGGMSQLHLVELMKSRNIYSVLADMNENAPAVKYADKYYKVSTLDFEGIKNVAVLECVDFIISVCADQMLLIAAKVSEELNLPCYIDYDTAQKVSNKKHMKTIFRENKIPTSNFIVGTSIKDEDVADLKFPLVVKPVDAYSSRGVKKVRDLLELKNAVHDAHKISRSGEVIVEEFVDGYEISVDVYVEGGKAKILCIRRLDKIKGVDGFIICRGVYPVNFSADVGDHISKVCQNLADSFELKDTPMLVQMKVDGERISVIEFCARTGGGIKYRLLPLVTNFDVVNAVLELTLGKKPHYNGYKINRLIVDEFVYCKPGVLSTIEGFNKLLEDKIIDHYAIFKPIGYEFKDIKSSGDRLAYFSISATTNVELETKYALARNRIHAFDKNGTDLICHEFMNYQYIK